MAADKAPGAAASRLDAATGAGCKFYAPSAADPRLHATLRMSCAAYALGTTLALWAHRGVLASGLFFSSAAFAAQDQLPIVPIKNHHTGTTLLPACTKDELYRLETATANLALGRNPAGAWAVARAMLCGKHPPAGNMPGLVAQERYGLTDDPGPRYALVPRDRIRPLKGKAYGVTVEADHVDIRFNYSTAGVCVGGFTLRPVHAQWLLVDTGEACD